MEVLRSLDKVPLEDGKERFMISEYNQEGDSFHEKEEIVRSRHLYSSNENVYMLKEAGREKLLNNVTPWIIDRCI